MNYIQKYKKISKGLKHMVDLPQWHNENTKRVNLSRWMNGQLKDPSLIALIEHKVSYIYKISEKVKSIIMNPEPKGIMVNDLILIKYTDLMSAKLEDDEEIFDVNDINYVLDNAKEGILKLYNENPIELKLLIAKHLIQ